MSCQNCAKLSSTVEELQTYIQTKRSQFIRDVVNLAAEPHVAIQDLIDILLRYVSVEADKQCRDLACPEPRCWYTADTYQLLQRHYLSHVSHSCHCPFCSKPLERVSQVVGHLSRCKARNGRALPKKITKLKLSAYDKLRRANNHRKQQASELTILDFATIFRPSNSVHHAGPLQTAEYLGQADSFQQTTHLRAQVAENFNFGAASVCPQDRRSIQFSSARLQGLAPGLIDNLADGTASSTLEFSAPQQAIAEGVTPFLPMLQHAPQQALAPALEDNFAEGTTSLPMLQHTPLAPGLLNNFAEGSTSFSPMLLPRVPQQTVRPGDSLPDAYSPHASLQHYYPAVSSTESVG